MIEITVVEKVDNSEAGKSDYRVTADTGEEFVIKTPKARDSMLLQRSSRCLKSEGPIRRL